jgi:subtilisin family serine protease
MKLQLMSTARRASMLASAAFLAACATDDGVAPTLQPTLPDVASLSQFDEGAETGTYLVKLRSGGRMSAARSSVAQFGATVVRELPAANLLYVNGLSDADAAALAADPNVTVIKDRLMRWIPDSKALTPTFLDAVAGPVATGTDQSSAQFYAQYQWSLKVTRADQAWTPSNGGAGETVCVLDTGVDPGHLDLNGTVDPSRTVSVILNPRFPSDATPFDYDFHGTFVSAQIRSNGIGMASVAPNATLCSIKVLSEDGAGTFGDIIFGIFLAAKFQADVINMSLGGFAQETNPANAPLLSLLQEVIDIARNRGTLVVAASGNDGFNMGDVRELFGFITIPAQMRGVISVGATGPFQQMNFDKATSYSNYGFRDALDLVAPGGNGGLPNGMTEDFIISACSRFAFAGACASGTRYLFGNGTSFAAPMVAGAGAVVESNVGAMTTGQLESCILDRAQYVGGPRGRYGKGRLDVRNASLCTGK